MGGDRGSGVVEQLIGPYDPESGSEPPEHDQNLNPIQRAAEWAGGQLLDAADTVSQWSERRDNDPISSQ